MKKISQILILTYASVMFFVFAQAAEITQSNQTEILTIDQKILILEKELDSLRENAFNNELKAQPYMFDNWHEFAEDIGNHEQNEKDILSIKKKINDLNDRKKILNQSPAEQ